VSTVVSGIFFSIHLYFSGLTIVLSLLFKWKHHLSGINS